MKTPPKPSACPVCGVRSYLGNRCADCVLDGAFFNEHVPHSKSEMRRLEAQGIEVARPPFHETWPNCPTCSKPLTEHDDTSSKRVAETQDLQHDDLPVKNPDWKQEACENTHSAMRGDLLNQGFEARRDAAAEAYYDHAGCFKAGADWARNNCPRCGDMFYDPRTIIKSEGQRAADWEDVAKRLERQLAEFNEYYTFQNVERLERELAEITGDFEDCYTDLQKVTVEFMDVADERDELRAELQWSLKNEEKHKVAMSERLAQVAELQAKVDSLTAENAELRLGRDTQEQEYTAAVKERDEARREVERLKADDSHNEALWNKAMDENERLRVALEYYAGSSFEAQDVAIAALEYNSHLTAKAALAKK